MRCSSRPRRPLRAGRPADPEKRAAVLGAAKRLFVERGFSATAMDDVAAAAGVSKLTAYRHFGSKDELFAAAITAHCTAMLDRAQPPTDRRQGTVDPRTALIRFGEAFLDLILSADALAIHRLIQSERDRVPQLGALFHAAAIAPTHSRLAAMIAQMGVTADADQGAGDLISLWRGRPMLPHEMGLVPMTAAERRAHVARTVELCLAAWAALADRPASA